MPWWYEQRTRQEAMNRRNFELIVTAGSALVTFLVLMGVLTRLLPAILSKPVFYGAIMVVGPVVAGCVLVWYDARRTQNRRQAEGRDWRQ